MEAGREQPLPARSRIRPWRRRGAAREPMLPYYLYRTGETVVRVLPRRAAYAVAARLADTMLAVAPRNFEPLRNNLQHVIPDADARTLRRVMRRNLRNLTRSWVDVMAMRFDPESTGRKLYKTGLQQLLDAEAEGRGVVAVSMHFGAWEKGLAGWNREGQQMALLAEELRPAKLFERIAGSRGALGVKVIPIDIDSIRNGDVQTARRHGAAAMREVMRHLRRGGTIAIAIDRDLAGSGEPMRFFDADAPIPLGVVEVAMRTGAALIPVALIRMPDGSVDGRVFPRVGYDAAVPRDAEVRRVTREILCVWEDLIRRHPEQWHVLDPIWPQAGRS